MELSWGWVRAYTATTGPLVRRCHILGAPRMRSALFPLLTENAQGPDAGIRRHEAAWLTSFRLERRGAGLATRSDRLADRRLYRPVRVGWLALAGDPDQQRLPVHRAERCECCCSKGSHRTRGRLPRWNLMTDQHRGNRKRRRERSMTNPYARNGGARGLMVPLFLRRADSKSRAALSRLRQIRQTHSAASVMVAEHNHRQVV